jgi:hypothetical protein
MVAPRVRACSDTKESDDKERRKGKKSGRRRSRTRGVLAFESRHFVSLQSYLLTVSRRLVVVQKLDARESSRLSLSLFSPKKKKSTVVTATLDSPRTHHRKTTTLTTALTTFSRSKKVFFFFFFFFFFREEKYTE